MKILTKISAVIVLSLSTSAHAAIISGPIDYTTSGLVGTADAGTGAVNPDQEAIWAQAILDLSAGTTATISDVDYITHKTDDYFGTIDALDYTKDDSESGIVGAGWEWLMAKYDGQNAGYVMYYLGGEATTIPELSDDIWVNGQDQGYQLSHWTAFNSTSVPEPSIIALFAAGLLGMGFSRRRRA
jgi:hypothetical protein